MSEDVAPFTSLWNGIKRLEDGIEVLVDENDELIKERDTLRKKLDELQKQLDEEIPYIDKFHIERDIANYKLEIAKKALRYYADPDEDEYNWTVAKDALAEIEKEGEK